MKSSTPILDGLARKIGWTVILAVIAGSAFGFFWLICATFWYGEQYAWLFCVWTSAQTGIPVEPIYVLFPVIAFALLAALAGCFGALTRRSVKTRIAMKEPTHDELVYQLMHQTPQAYQQKLAVAYHRAKVAKDPTLLNKFGPPEQEAAKQLAEMKYPLSPEAQQALQQEAQQKAENPPATPTGASPSQPTTLESSQAEPEEAMSSEEEQAHQGAMKQGHPDFPRSIPSPELTETQPEGLGPPGPEEQASIDAGRQSLRANFPRQIPPRGLTNTKSSSSWDEGQVDEDGPVTASDWQAFDLAHDRLRAQFPRSTPPYQPGKRIYKEEVPAPTVRQLQLVDTENPVNFQASVRALASIRPADLFTEGAVFVGRDSNRAILTKHHDGTYFLSYFDSGVSKPWKTATYDSLESAVVAVTGRQLYFYGRR